MLIHRDTSSGSWFYKGTKPAIGTSTRIDIKKCFFCETHSIHSIVTGSHEKLKRSKAAYRLHISHNQTVIPRQPRRDHHDMTPPPFIDTVLRKFTVERKFTVGNSS